MEAVWLCPTPPEVGCSWEGWARDVVTHFRNEHEELLLYSNTFSVNTASSAAENKLLCLDNEIYLVQTKVASSRGILELRLRYFGSHEQALALRYNVQICIGQYAFETLPGEKCSVINIKNGYFEVDLQLIALASGQQDLSDLICLLNIGKTAPMVNETPLTTPKRNSYSESNDVLKATSTQEVLSKDASLISKDKQDTTEDPVELRISPRFIRNSSQRNSFLESFFFEELESKIHDRNTLGYVSEIEEHFHIDIDSSLRCSTCGMDYMLPPIFLCMDGHSVCGGCRFEPCGICGFDINDLRNTDLEEASKRRALYACKYAALGCLEQHPYEGIKTHQAICRYCIYKCPICPSEGKLSEITTHFKVLHSSVKMHEGLVNKFPRNTTFSIVNRDVGVFYCCSQLTNRGIQWNVDFCGPKERWFSCELRIKSKKAEVSYPLIRKTAKNRYGLTLTLGDLKATGLKDKYATLYIFSY